MSSSSSLAQFGGATPMATAAAISLARIQLEQQQCSPNDRRCTMPTPPAATPPDPVARQPPSLPSAAGFCGQITPGLVLPQTGLCFPPYGRRDDQNVKVTLDNAELWQRFNSCTTEMIITKTGRRMFPTLRYKVSGLEAHASYAILLEMRQADESRYKFQNGGWVVSGRAEQGPGQANSQSISYHPDGKRPGHHWMSNSISFHRVKLTNNSADRSGNVLLNSMHMYQPVLCILKWSNFEPSPQLVATAAFPETKFVAVTAYQNDNVIKLKIEYNPFAKGFRGGESAAPLNSVIRKRKSSPAEPDSGRPSPKHCSLSPPSAVSSTPFRSSHVPFHSMQKLLLSSNASPLLGGLRSPNEADSVLSDTDSTSAAGASNSTSSSSEGLRAPSPLKLSPFTAFSPYQQQPNAFHSPLFAQPPAMFPPLFNPLLMGQLYNYTLAAQAQHHQQQQQQQLLLSQLWAAQQRQHHHEESRQD